MWSSNRIRGLAVAVAVALPAMGCGAPTGQIVTPAEGPVSFGLPATYTDLGAAAGQEPNLIFGLPDSPIDALSGDPVLFAGTSSTGSEASFSSLRMMSTYNEFDPLDPNLDPLPNGIVVVGYTEINEPDVWGVRILLTLDQGASDFQALVERATGEVVVSRVMCTQACFIEQIDLIEDIQGSWRLE